MFGAIRKFHNTVAITQRAGINEYLLASKHGQFMSPEIIPELIVGAVGNSGVKACLNKLPAFLLADHLRQCSYIIIGVGIAEGLTDRMVKILTVDERNCALYEGLS
jgi:mannose/fructose/N-acetylgalactosamine-specific phosphotransferase system component IIC